MALIVARVARPGSKLATTRWWADTTLAVDLGVGERGHRRRVRGHGLAGRAARSLIESGPGPPASGAGGDGAVRPVELVGGRHVLPLAARGYSRDRKAGKAQIEYGLMTDGEGRPVAVEVFAGNTADPTAFIAAVAKVTRPFRAVRGGHGRRPGHDHPARIDAIRELGGLGWVSALRAPAIKKLAESGAVATRPVRQTDLAEIAHPDFPGERLMACKNPLLADQRARKRSELLDATEALLAPIKAAVDAGRLAGADKIGLRVGKVIGPSQDGQTLHRDHRRHQPGLGTQATTRSPPRPPSTAST